MKLLKQGKMFLIAAMFLPLSILEAYPMFVKQTGLDCMSCHMQHSPKLTSVGRKFAVSGMTVSKKSFDENSSGVDMYVSGMFKSMYVESFDKPAKDGDISTTTTTLRGDWSVPRSANLLLGGRVSDNIGAIIDLSYKDEHKEGIRGKIVYAKEIQDGYIGAVAYSTPSFGPFSGMENYNTGLNKPLRTFDTRKYSNAFQASNIGTGEATGAQIYFDRDNILGGEGHLFVTVGLFTPGQDNAGMKMSSNVLGFARMAYEYPTDNFTFIFGGFLINGGGTASSGEQISIEQDTYGIDFQLEGYLWDKSVSLVMSKVLKNRVTYTGLLANTLNPEEYTNLDSTAFSVEGEINIIDSFGVKMAYMTFNDLSPYTAPDENPSYAANHIDVRDIKHAYTIGADYSFEAYLPMKLTVEHAWVEPSLDRMEGYREFLVSFNILF